MDAAANAAAAERTYGEGFSSGFARFKHTQEFWDVSVLARLFEGSGWGAFEFQGGGTATCDMDCRSRTCQHASSSQGVADKAARMQRAYIWLLCEHCAHRKTHAHNAPECTQSALPLSRGLLNVACAVHPDR